MKDSLLIFKFITQQQLGPAAQERKGVEEKEVTANRNNRLRCNR